MTQKQFETLIAWLLVLVLFLGVGFIIMSVLAYLVCACIGCEFRWLYPLIGLIVVEILKYIFAGGNYATKRR